jgi:hypothetical protein
MCVSPLKVRGDFAERAGRKYYGILLDRFCAILSDNSGRKPWHTMSLNK